MKNKDIEKFVNYCEKNLDFTIVPPNGYPSAPICVLDAIFSLGIRYTTVVKVINNFCRQFKIEWDKSSKRTSDLLLEIDNKIKDENLNINQFARKYLNENKTSSNNGILKAEAFMLALNVMRKYNIETCEDATKKVDENFDSEFMSIKGQTYGTSLHYFYMLCGDDNLVKVDRHIKKFSCQALERNNLDPQKISELFQDAVGILKDKYPNMTPRQLDYIVWRYMRKQRNNKNQNTATITEEKTKRDKLSLSNKHPRNGNDIISIEYEVMYNNQKCRLFVAYEKSRGYYCQIRYKRPTTESENKLLDNLIEKYEPSKWFHRKDTYKKPYRYIVFGESKSDYKKACDLAQIIKRDLDNQFQCQ